MAEDTARVPTEEIPAAEFQKIMQGFSIDLFRLHSDSLKRLRGFLIELLDKTEVEMDRRKIL
jgi:hypothetical protein